MKSAGEKQPGIVAGTNSFNGNDSTFHLRTNMGYTISYLKKYNVHELGTENQGKSYSETIYL